jgi:dihydrofolate synthase/folylpolyglutamate synthase
MDHMNVLGDTLAKIAYEKAGIIKPGRPVIVAPQKEEALEVVRQVAQERHSSIAEVGRDYHFESISHSLSGQTFRIWKQGGEPLTLTMPLLGIHQVENATTAFAALQTARAQGLTISDAAIREGFASVVWPGRFELLRQEPPLIVDSAHNRESALRLRQALDDYLPGLPVVLLFGASEDKDVDGMFAELGPRISYVVATQSIHPRAMEAEKLVEVAQHHQMAGEAVLPLEKAVEIALQRAGKDTVVLATGSLFIAGAVREVWHRMAHNAPII